MKPTMRPERSQRVVAGDIALSLTRWTLDGTAPDGSPVHLQGEATDVFRREPDGSWRVVIDNPWGAALLAALA